MPTQRNTIYNKDTTEQDRKRKKERMYQRKQNQTVTSALLKKNGENNQIFCYNGRINKKDSTIYVDFTGRFPIRSMDGLVSIFIIYDWTTNAVLEKPVKNMAEETTVSCFKQQIIYLYKKRLQTHPQHNRQCGIKSSTIVPRGREGEHTTCGSAQTSGKCS